MLDLTILNTKQKEAVTAPICPILVSAGAGSGKTRVLAYRIAYLIEQGLVAPGNILALTFTNKSAKEMRERVGGLMGMNLSGASFGFSPYMPNMGTFHSVGVRLLREFGEHIGLAKNFTIFDSDDSSRVIKRICKEVELPENFAASLVGHFISQAKNELVDPDEFRPDVPKHVYEKIRSVYRKYAEELQRNQSVDFDDLLIMPIKLWNKDLSVLKQCRERFQYILVDEYQDTNSAQYEWLKILRPDGRIFAVGDDAQSIYGFRGSNYANWQRFQSDFEGCLVIHLEQNYRSTQNILDAAGKVLLSTGNDHKLLWTEAGRGESVKVHELSDDAGEAEFVVRTIAKLSGGQSSASPEYETEAPSIGGGGLLDKYLSAAKMGRSRPIGLRGLSVGLDKSRLEQTAVLYRTHGQSRSLEEAFISSGIPYKIVGGLRFYQRKEIKDLLAAVRLLLNPSDVVAMDRLVSFLPLGVGEKSLPHLLDAVKGKMTFDEGVASLSASTLQARQKNGALKFFADMSVLQFIDDEASSEDVLKAVIRQLDFKTLLKDGTEQGEARWENLQELLSVAVTRLSGIPWKQGVEQLLEEAALLSESVSEEQGGSGCVQLMTIHAAKGLEFDHVFVTGWEEGVLPHSRAIFKNEELAEEIRLAYVAMTRARKQLFLTFARARMLSGSFRAGMPSRFLRALPEQGVVWSGGRSRSIRMPESHSGLVYEPMDEF